MLEDLPAERLRVAGTGHERRVGVEIELSGVAPGIITSAIESLYGGQTRTLTALEYQVEQTRFGNFGVELDAVYLKALAEKKVLVEQDEGSKGDGKEELSLFDMLTRAAEQLVPWEVVTPPVPFSSVTELSSMVKQLRQAGALGTRHAMHYAFGVHLNPELPDLKTSTIVNYLRAYFCLYDWIVLQEQTDLTRKLTTYIKHFDKDYIAQVVDWGYRPDQTQLIDDYLLSNPTRNRSLDMLPLFAFLDDARVRRQVNDPRIKSRPTFHYRLPNCDIDNAAWDISTPWNLWLEVEKLAADEARLETLCRAYQQHLKRFMHGLDDRWARYVDEIIGTAN